MSQFRNRADYENKIYFIEEYFTVSIIMLLIILFINYLLKLMYRVCLASAREANLVSKMKLSFMFILNNYVESCGPRNVFIIERDQFV